MPNAPVNLFLSLKVICFGNRNFVETLVEKFLKPSFDNLYKQIQSFIYSNQKIDIGYRLQKPCQIQGNHFACALSVLSDTEYEKRGCAKHTPSPSNSHTWYMKH